MTASNPGMTLTIAFNYGGRAELVDAMRRLAAEARAGRIDPKRIDERSIHRALYDPELPDVDLFIRTGGEQRISNYLLWQSSYAELVFQDVLWPDFTGDHLKEALDEFARRSRRFGKI
jgi:undecaprenyl diphosphate synthase